MIGAPVRSVKASGPLLWQPWPMHGKGIVARANHRRFARRLAGMNLADELLKTSFFGPWVPAGEGEPRVQHVYASLLHWYESAKFMPLHPTHRDYILHSPTFKEAKRYSRLRKDAWRSDWNMVRPSILISGLGMLALQRSDLNLMSAELSDIKAGLGDLALPERFIDACLERFETWRTGAFVTFIGADTAPEAIVGKAVAKLVSPLPTWTLVSSCNAKTPWRLHDWCLSRFVPVAYMGKPETRNSRPLQESLIDYADQVVIFEEKRAKKHDKAITLARGKRRKVTLEIYTPADEANRSLEGMN